MPFPISRKSKSLASAVIALTPLVPGFARAQAPARTALFLECTAGAHSFGSNRFGEYVRASDALLEIDLNHAWPVNDAQNASQGVRVYATKPSKGQPRYSYYVQESLFGRQASGKIFRGETTAARRNLALLPFWQCFSVRGL